MSRKTLALATACAAAAALSLSACSEGMGGDGETGGILRFSLNQTKEHPSYIALDHFSDRLEDATGGRWSIDIYPNETLGAQAEALQLVSDGIIDMAVVSGAQLGNLNPDFTVYNLPRVFDDVAHQMDVVNDPSQVTQELFTSLEDSQDITVLGGLTQGARSVYTTFGPIERPEDLAGKKMRVQESSLNIAMAEALGASATPMAFGELYTGLQSGVVDAAENNEVSYYTQKHYEVAPYFTYTNHLVGIDYVIINTETLQKMSEQDRAAFRDGWNKTWQEHTQLWEEATQEAIEGAKAGGATFTEIDTTPFDERLEELVDEYIRTDFQQKLLDDARRQATQD